MRMNTSIVLQSSDCSTSIKHWEAAKALTSLSCGIPVAPTTTSTSMATPEPIPLEADPSADITTCPVSSSSQSTPSPLFIQRSFIFPERLMQVLNEPAHVDDIAWLPHGQAFVILRPDKFMKDIAPKYFPPQSNSAKSSMKWLSFTRKLHRWGFYQQTTGPDAGSYSNKHFRRDDPELCLEMKCARSSSASKPHRRQVTRLTKEALDVLDKETAMPVLPAPGAPTMPQATSVPKQSQLVTSVAVVSDVDGALSTEKVSHKLPACSSKYFAQTLITHNQHVMSIYAKNLDLEKQSLSRRREAERLRVARAMLFENYLQAIQRQN